MTRLWQSLAQRIGVKIARHFASYEDADFAGQIESLQRSHRVFSERNNMDDFWFRVGAALRTERCIGTREGADIAKAVLKPHVRTEVRK